MQYFEGVAWGVTDHIGRIVLKRSEQANTLTSGASRALVRAIGEVLDRQPRVVLIAAEGPIFCAGGDINEFATCGPALDVLVNDILTPLHPALHRLASAPLPVVAAVNGPVAGAGIGLALCADFVLGGASMKLRTGYAAIGLSPDAGASYFLARRVGALRAQQWLMLSETIEASACLQHGVIDALHPDAELTNAAEVLVARLAGAASGSLTSIKLLCSGVPGRNLHEHLELEKLLLAVRARSAEGQEGVRAFIEKRRPQFSAL